MPEGIEIVAIGNELLKGITVNTNASEISHALFKNGYKCQQHVVVPDHRELIKKQLIQSLKRSKIVITTGGLGPTCDDITRQVAAEVFESDFTFNVALAEELKQRYGNLPISLDDQATVPTKASLLKNPLGTAPGIVFNTEIGTLILMPGVPKEMRAMLHDQLIPYLLKNFPNDTSPLSRAVHFFGVGESTIDPTLRALEVQHPTAEFGIYPSHGLLSVYTTFNQPTAHSAHELETITTAIKQQFPEHFYSETSEKIEVAIQDLLVQKDWTLCTAESCTGGAIAARLTKIPGSSQYFLGGFVTYSNQLKESLLHVDSEIILRDGAVNEETVIAMAKGALHSTGSDFSIAVSGIAGPTGGSESKPVGTIWIGIGKKDGTVCTHKIKAYGNREMIIERGVNAALGELFKCASR